MAWRIKDEWIDHAKGEHVVIFENPDIQVPLKGSNPPRMEPLTYPLTNNLKLDACPHCGTPTGAANGLSIDFAEKKAAVLKALNDHHRQSLAYSEKHRSARVGSGPKK
jgi:hypothetical protein